MAEKKKVTKKAPKKTVKKTTVKKTVTKTPVIKASIKAPTSKTVYSDNTFIANAWNGLYEPTYSFFVFFLFGLGLTTLAVIGFIDGALQGIFAYFQIENLQTLRLHYTTNMTEMVAEATPLSAAASKLQFETQAMLRYGIDIIQLVAALSVWLVVYVWSIVSVWASAIRFYEEHPNSAFYTKLVTGGATLYLVWFLAHYGAKAALPFM